MELWKSGNYYHHHQQQHFGMVIILREQNFNTNSFRCDMDQQQQQDRQLRELHVEEGIQLHQHHHEDYHHHHHHLQEEESQLQRAAGLYWKMTGGLVLTSGLLFGSCVFCKLVTTRDVLLALLATLLLWSAVTLLTTFRADLDLTGPSFLNGCLTPLLLFILYLLLWLGYCRCRSSSPPGHQHHHHHHQTPSNSPPPVDFEQHLIMVTVIEVVIVLSIVLIISQWLSGRSRHLLTIVASCRPYSLLLLFWCLLLLEALLLLLVIFIRRQTSSPSDHHHHHQHHTASAS